ncbi:hypothetical protein ACHWQZ_G003034 [Mnemiopsis leidyi]
MTERRFTYSLVFLLLLISLESTHGFTFGYENSENETQQNESESDLLDTVFDLRLEHRDHTYADINSYRTLYLSLKLTVKMHEERSVTGYVDTTFVKLKPSWMMSKFGKVGPDLNLDIGPHVTVTDIENIDTGKKVEFEKACNDSITISVLQCVLQIKDPIDYVGEFRLRIHYSVSDKTSALHFIPPHQTEDNQYFLVSTTQPSDARGWIPCQDTPALKYPYQSEISVKKPFTVLMSGSIISTTVEETDEGTWETVQFRQDLPVPPFLIAITVADMVAVEVREHEESAVTEEAAVPSIKVWGERSVMERLRADPGRIFSMIPEMMDICEKWYGRYDWGTYDVVLTPPGYAFKGMEFPQMNFIAATNIDFDNTAGPNFIYANVIAHEMIHSWFGNLVTPKYAGDIWLAEGVTTFEELELMEEYYGDPKIGEYLRRWRYISLKGVLESYTGFSAKYKILTPYLTNEHPFHGFTYVHYNKGGLFLEYIANRTGRAELDRGLRKYLDLYKYQSVDTADFVHVLYEEFGFETDKEIERDIFVWLERPHTQVPMKLFQSEIYEECVQIYRALTRSRKQRENKWVLADIAESFKHGTGPLASSAPNLRSQMMIVLERMENVVKKVNMTETRTRNWKRLINRLDKVFSFTSNADSDPDIFAMWAQIAIKFNHTETMSKMPDFFEKQGRLDLVFTVLDAPTDNRLRGTFANILNTKYDLTRYPGFIGELLRGYVEWFIRYYES